MQCRALQVQFRQPTIKTVYLSQLVSLLSFPLPSLSHTIYIEKDVSIT